MRILVFGHRLETGGSQTNTIDLAAAARDLHGHEVWVFATPGPAAELVARRGLELIPAPEPSRFHPAWPTVRALDLAVRRVRPDLLHVWEWPQVLDAYYGAHLWRDVPMLATNMTMDPLRSIPPELPLTVGTQAIVDASRSRRSGPVWLIEPPFDVDADDPSRVDPEPFTTEHGVRDDGLPLVVTVSRIVEDMKLEGIRDAIRATELLDVRCPVRLAIVGGGAAFDEVAASAAAVNRRLGRSAVVTTGPLQDPRPAYAAADVMLGMGSSAIRGLAFGKPTVVLGEQGFSEIFDATTQDGFFRTGYYGIGPGSSNGSGAGRLADLIERLVTDSEVRSRAAATRQLMVERYGLPAVAGRLDRAYGEAARPSGRGATLANALRHLPATFVTQLPEGQKDRLRHLLPRGAGRS